MEASVVEKLRNVLAETFELPVADVPADAALGHPAQWDSMGHMNVMAALEERFGVEISADTITQLTSVGAICEHLANHPNVRVQP